MPVNYDVREDLVTGTTATDDVVTKNNQDLTQDEVLGKLYDFVKIISIEFTLYLNEKFIISTVEINNYFDGEILLDEGTIIKLTLKDSYLQTSFSPALMIDAPFPASNILIKFITILFGKIKLLINYQTDNGVINKIDEVEAVFKKALPQIVKETDLDNKNYRAFSDRQLLDTIAKITTNFLEVKWNNEKPSIDRNYSMFINPTFKLNLITKRVVSQYKYDAKKRKSGIEILNNSDIEIELLLNDNLEDLQAKTKDYNLNKTIFLDVNYLQIKIDKLSVYYNDELILEIFEIVLKKGGIIELPNTVSHGILLLVDGLDLLIDLFKIAIVKQVANKNPYSGFSKSSLDGITHSKAIQNFLFTTIAKFISEILKKEIFKQPVIKNIDIKKSLEIN